MSSWWAAETPQDKRPCIFPHAKKVSLVIRGECLRKTLSQYLVDAWPLITLAYDPNMVIYFRIIRMRRDWNTASIDKIL